MDPEPRPFTETSRYRILVQYRQWIGKPDPSGFSTYLLYSNDPSWLHEEAVRIQRRGHRIVKWQRRDAAVWITM